MPDPIRIDEAFQETMEVIESAKSYRYIFFRFRLFAALLEGEYLKFQSYLFQLFDELPLYSLPLMWSGIDPARISSDADLLQNISEELSSDAIDEVIGRLRQVSFLQFICLSEPEKADQQFIQLFKTSLFGNKREGGTGSTCDNLSYTKEKLQAFTEARELTSKQQKIVDQLLKDIALHLRRDELEALIPVAEENDGSEGTISGRLRKIMLRVSGTNSGKDVIIRSYPVMGAESVSGIDTSVVTNRARTLAEEKSSKLSREFFNARLHYEINGAEHAGNSGNLALGALWYTFLLKQAELRERYTVSGDAAITGDINSAGKVLPVDPNTIQAKAEAAFFSWANLLAVPISQYSLFNEQIRKLKERYPARELSLMGVEKLEDLFYDRRLTDYVVENRIKHSFKKFKREKFKVVGIPLIVILLLIIARLAYGPVDKNPVIVEFEGSLLFLKNSDGSTISKLEIGRQSVEYFLNTPSADRFPRFQLKDITSDGINELFYSSYVDRHMSAESFIRAWSVSGDSLIWEQEITFEYDYPEQNAFLNSNMIVREMYIINTRDGPKLALTANPQQYFQTMVNVFDLNTGSVKQEFIHPGRVFDMHVVDLNCDGADEMVLAGVSNAYWKAAITVLEYNEGEKGYAPATSPYRPSGLQRTNPKRYMLIPKTLIADFFEPLQKYNYSSGVNFDPVTRNLFFEVVEGRRELFDHERDAPVFFYFDNDLSPLGIGTSDTYDVAAREFYEEGKIPLIPDFDYFEALQDSILYWTGDEFVPTQEYFSDENE